MIRLYLTTTLVVASSLSSFSQTEKGNFMIGGTMSFQAGDNNGINSVSISLRPAVSYFIFNRFAAGLITGALFSKSTDSMRIVGVNEFTIGPTIRYYFPLSSKWALFPQVEYTYIHQIVKWKYLATSDEATGTVTDSRTNVGAGITYFFTRNVAIEGLLYSTINQSLKGLNFRVSLQVYINKKVTYD